MIDFLKQDGVFIKIMQDSMEAFDNKLTFAGKTIQYESYMLNMKKLFLICDDKLRLIEKRKNKCDEFFDINEEKN